MGVHVSVRSSFFSFVCRSLCARGVCVCVCVCVCACTNGITSSIERVNHTPGNNCICFISSPTPPLPPSHSGGINDLVVDMIKCCREQGIPLIFAMTRQHLGKLMRKKVPVSAVGIFSYDGAEVGEH